MAKKIFSDKRTPVYTILGGSMYDSNADLKQGKNYWSPRFSGENYAYFRLDDTEVDGRRYVSSIYTKMPVCIFQFENEAIGLMYKTVVENQIPSLTIWNDENGCHFEYTDEITHNMKSKTKPLLGDWEVFGAYKPNIAKLPDFKVVKGSTWWQLIREIVEDELQDRSAKLEDSTVQDLLALVNAFHDRIYDAVNRVHLDTVYPDRPERYADAIFSLTSFEACRLLSLYKYNKDNHAKCKSIANRLVFDSTVSAYLHEVGDCRVWHNGFDTLKHNSRLYGCTTFGTGYSGYPGGMATFLRKLLEYVHLSRDTNLLPYLKQGINWLLLVQNPDGSFPFTIPAVPEISSPGQTTVTGPDSKALGGAAEAVRALIWAFRVFGDNSYLEAAKRGIRAINPSEPYYVFRGYGDFRDGSEFETDVTSGLQLANANLEFYAIDNNTAYLHTAEALAYYVLTWHHWWSTDKIDPYGFIDPMSESFCPHISPYNTAVASELYSKLFVATQDQFWQKIADFAFARASSLINPHTGGVSEVYNFNKLDEITIMGGESGMVSWSLLDAGCALLSAKDSDVLRRSSVTADGPLHEAFNVMAQVGFLEDNKISVPNPKQVLRSLKPHVKRLVKMVLGVKGVQRLGKRKSRRLSPESQAPKDGRLIYEIYSSGDYKHSMNFSTKRTGAATFVRLAAMEHNPYIKKVAMPVLEFPCLIKSVRELDKIGAIITACEINLSNKQKLRLDFLQSTTGLGISSIHIEGDRLVCEASTRAGWQFGGECNQVIRVTKIEEQQ